MGKQPTDIMRGTLHLLVLKTVALEPRHGVGIAALHRLEQEGFIAGDWSTTPDGHRAKYYRITPAGQRKLAAERKNWSRIVVAVGQVLEAE